jgi:hypothetical protein
LIKFGAHNYLLPWKSNTQQYVRYESSRHFRNKKREYLKDKIDELATKSKNKKIRDLYLGLLATVSLTSAYILANFPDQVCPY